MRKILVFACLLLLAGGYSAPGQAALISVAYSGTVQQNYFDVPVGTIVSAGFSYDTDTLADFALNGNAFAVFDVVFTMLGETVTNDFGYLQVNSDGLKFQSGPYLSFGGNTPFSDYINGIEIRGIGFTLDGSFVADQLPTDIADIYGLGGRFFVNRSLGELYDVNHPEQLQLPPSPVTSVAEPPLFVLFAIGLVLLVALTGRWSRQAVPQQL